MNKKTSPWLIYILVVCAGFALGNYAYNYFNLKNKPGLPEQKTLPAQPKAETPLPVPVKQIAPEPPVKPADNPELSLVLNGVFFERGESYALINNKIVRVGEQIEGATVKEIAITGVELEFEGKTIRLLSPS